MRAFAAHGVEGRGFPAAPRQEKFGDFAVASFTHAASLAPDPRRRSFDYCTRFKKNLEIPFKFWAAVIAYSK